MPPPALAGLAGTAVPVAEVLVAVSTGGDVPASPPESLGTGVSVEVEGGGVAGRGVAVGGMRTGPAEFE